MRKNKALRGLLLLLLTLGLYLLQDAGLVSLSGRKQTSSSKSFPEKGLVTVVYDGDTIKISPASGKERKVRLIGVDAAEIGDTKEEADFWAHMAKRFAFYHLYRKQVGLSYDEEREDGYRRLLAYVWTIDGTLFNELIIREGFARILLRFPYRKDLRERFRRAETEARKQGKGIWGKGDPPLIAAGKAGENLGKYMAVRFTCREVFPRGSFYYLSSGSDDFRAVIPREKVPLFPTLTSYAGKELVVMGFIDEYRGVPQVMVFFPRQVFPDID